jgi:hypothetical protein
LRLARSVRVRRPSRALSAIAIIFAVVCASAGAAGSPTDLESQIVAWVASGQYGKVYDLMPPQQQEVIPYNDWYSCTAGALMLAKGFGADVRTSKFVNAKLHAQTRLMTMPGTNVKVRATVLTVTVSLVEGGKRTTSTAPAYWVRLGGRWRLIDENVADYKKHKCGS